MKNGCLPLCWAFCIFCSWVHFGAAHLFQVTSLLHYLRRQLWICSICQHALGAGHHSLSKILISSVLWYSRLCAESEQPKLSSCDIEWKEKADISLWPLIAASSGTLGDKVTTAFSRWWTDEGSPPDDWWFSLCCRLPFKNSLSYTHEMTKKHTTIASVP